jgi:hypothetical protein
MGSRPGSVMSAGPPMKKYGKLVLVDLAGSERLKVWYSYCHMICAFNSTLLCCNAVQHQAYTNWHELQASNAEPFTHSTVWSSIQNSGEAALGETGSVHRSL